MATELCSIEQCNQEVFSECNCCRQFYCKQHLSEHYNKLTDQVNPLVNDINDFEEDLNSFDVKSILVESQEKLDEWRSNYHEKVEEIYRRAQKELEERLMRKIGEEKESLEKLRNNVKESFENEKASDNMSIQLMSMELSRLKENFTRIAQTHFRVLTRPMDLDENSINIEENIRGAIDLSKILDKGKELKSGSNSSTLITSSERFVLFYQTTSLSLFDEKMKLIEKRSWIFGSLISVCWSSTIRMFFALTDRNLFSISENLRNIRRFEIEKSNGWSVCDCCSTKIFLVNNENGPKIYPIALTTSFPRENVWSYPNDENHRLKIEDAVCRAETIALIVRNNTNRTIQVELRFSSTFDCLWISNIDLSYRRGLRLRCSSLNFDEWLILNEQNNELLHFGKSGELKGQIKYPTTPFAVHLFKENFLIVATKNSKVFHQIM